MNRSMGIEGKIGIGGGGIVTPQSQKNLEKGERLARQRKPHQAAPYIQKAMKDPNNLDAMISAAFLNTAKDAARVLEAAEARGREIMGERLVVLKPASTQNQVLNFVRLGPDCFDDGGRFVGKYWSLPETRPYMRVLQAQVRIYVEVEDYVASANTVIEMLRLCPGDNLNQRTWLGSVLIHAGRYSDALYFVQSCLDKEIPWPDRIRFREPKYEPLSPETEKSLDWNHGAILYSAALACFKLRGDCPLARQYLRISAKANPNVLIKILGRKTKPASLNMEARMYNGREDAHDYLWLTQDLWMTDDVWSWVQENRDVEELVLKECSRDRCPNQEQKAAQFQRCGSCHTVVYCCRECQKGDWKKHKPDCIAHKERKETINAVTRGKPTSNSANIYMVDMMC
ncbi:hypothetical protein C8J56DRAFT_322921 [Mycena floridula]|nr:hypothetical protein C8J56DRAFT_322921 [Mycena floridula]